LIPNSSFSLNGPLPIVWQEQQARLRPGIFDHHTHEACEQAVEMCLSGNGLRGFEETGNVQRASTRSASVGGDSQVWVAGVEVGDFGVCAPAGVSGTGIAQVVVSEAGWAARQIEMAREVVCQGFLMEVAMLLRQGHGGMIMFQRLRPAGF